MNSITFYTLKFNNINRCTICLSKLEENDKIKELNCSHYYHSGCIN